MIMIMTLKASLIELNLFNDQYFILFREESLKDDHLQCNGVLKGVNI